MLRLGVAATFVIEIPATFLLIFPSVTVRKIGAWGQIMLQLLIIATGNYNFFNLLTIMLCLPCMIGMKTFASFYRAKGGHHRIWNGLQMAACVMFLAWSCNEMFSVEHFQDPMDRERRMTGLKLVVTKHDCNDLIEWAIPIVVPSTIVFTAMTGVHCIMNASSARARFGTFFHTFVCCFCISFTAVPLLDLTPEMNQSNLFGVTLRPSMWRNFRQNSFFVSNGYGLFRRMTGVGSTVIVGEHVGWAGLPPSIVARPEIIVDAVIHDFDDENLLDNATATNDELWTELKFRWKPGNISQRPLQVAPHQPRFDWRMWFAALGTYQHNAWFISFLGKILHGCPPVLDLMDEPELLAGKRKITRVRANLYEYDFTRLNTEWARRIPGVKILDDSRIFQFPDQFWTRKLIREYLPPIDAKNPSLQAFLRRGGYDPHVCASNKERCLELGPLAKVLCQGASLIRRWKNLSLAFLISFFLVELWKTLKLRYSPSLESKKVKTE